MTTEQQPDAFRQVSSNQKFEVTKWVLMGDENMRILHANGTAAPTTYETWQEAMQACEEAVLKRGHLVTICGLIEYATFHRSQSIEQVATKSFVSRIR
jgi:hypothetical protein